MGSAARQHPVTTIKVTQPHGGVGPESQRQTRCCACGGVSQGALGRESPSEPAGCHARVAPEPRPSAGPLWGGGVTDGLEGVSGLLQGA
ncbi:unnamed protein product [Boreogadus saida]